MGFLSPEYWSWLSFPSPGALPDPGIEPVTPALLRRQETGFDPWVGKVSWRNAQQPTGVFLPGESHGQRSLQGYSPWGCKESDTAERLTLLSCRQILYH